MVKTFNFRDYKLIYPIDFCIPVNLGLHFHTAMCEKPSIIAEHFHRT